MFNDAGPLWIGNLWDSKLINEMYSSLLKNYNKKIKTMKELNNNITNNKELLKFLKIIKEESKINCIGFYDIHNIAKKRKLKRMMKKEDIVKKIKKKGFNASNTHFSGTGIRSNISYDKLISLLKE